MTIKQAYRKLMKRLTNLGLKPYFYHHSKWGSYYIKFEDTRLRSVRVGDHDGRERYRYKWNLRSDLDKADIQMDKGCRRFYFPLSQIEGMANRIKKYHNTILKNEREENNGTKNN